MCYYKLIGEIFVAEENTDFSIIARETEKVGI